MAEPRALTLHQKIALMKQQLHGSQSDYPIISYVERHSGPLERVAAEISHTLCQRQHSVERATGELIAEMAAIQPFHACNQQLSHLICRVEQLEQLNRTLKAQVVSHSEEVQKLREMIRQETGALQELTQLMQERKQREPPFTIPICLPPDARSCPEMWVAEKNAKRH